MFDGLFIVSLIANCLQGIKEVCQPTIPAENWANKELYHKDMMAGVPIEQRMKNLKNGKYKLAEVHPEPHRDSVSGKIIIENETLYHKDVENYGSRQAWKWAEQGRYNLTPDEMEKERERHKKKWEYLDRL